MFDGHREHCCGVENIGGEHKTRVSGRIQLAYINISSAILGLFLLLRLLDVVYDYGRVEYCTPGKKVKRLLVCSSPRMRVPYISAMGIMVMRTG